MKAKFQVKFFSALFISFFILQAGTLQILPNSIRCPDLIIRKISMDPINPTTAKHVSFKVTVKNIGNSKASPSVLAIRVGGESKPKTYPIPYLKPNATISVFRFYRFSKAQNYRTEAIADYSKKIKECKEGNNTKHIDFKVTEGCFLPDLVITSFTMSPENPTINETITFKATVHNAGSTRNESCTFCITVFTYRLWANIPPLSPHTSITITKTTKIHQSYSGAASAYADWSKRIDECNEKNNKRTILYTVE